MNLLYGPCLVWPEEHIIQLQEWIRCMLIAQLSDPHVMPRGILYQGVVDSNAMLESAIRTVNQISPRPDILLLTGDLVENSEPAAYEEAQRLLSDLAIPLVAIPGNHDERENFRACFARERYMPKQGPIHFVFDDIGPVRIIGLDVTVPNKHYGLIDDIAIGWLSEALSQNPDKPTIIMMHQPPFMTEIPYLDAYTCHGGDRLFDVVSRYPGIQRIVCGHVHRFMTIKSGNTLICAAPSTASTIALRIGPDVEAASYIEPPGFLLHHWQGSGNLLTHLLHVGKFPGPYPFA